MSDFETELALKAIEDGEISRDLGMPEFQWGSEKQQRWAMSLRLQFLNIHMDAGTDPLHVWAVIELRRDAAWWIQQRDRLDAPSIVSAALSYISVHGSLERAIEATNVQMRRKFERYESYLNARETFRSKNKKAAKK
jgi:hypothetical protein